VSIKYKVYSYAYLLMAVHRSIKDLATVKPFPFVESLNILLYSAFAFEAFLNHLGQEVFPLWAPLKRKLSVVEKFDAIVSMRGIQVDWGARPYQSVAEIVRFRNLVVHAESTEVDMHIVSGEGAQDRGHWQSYCTRDTALRLSADIEDLIKSLPGMLGIAMPRATILAEPVDHTT